MPTKKPGKTTTDLVMRVRRGEAARDFNYEEWVCVRNMWLRAGQPMGEVSLLFGTDEGVLGSEGLAQLIRIAEETEPGRMRQLVGTTGSSWDELLELVKSTWKLPYRKITDSTDRIYVGSKIIADFGAAGAPALVAVGDLPAYRNAHEKLRAVLAGTGDEVSFLVLGPRFLPERRRAGLL